MRKLFLINIIVGFIFHSYSCKGQPEWAPIGATWYYTQNYVSTSYEDFIKIESIGDTLINGKLCKILLKNVISCDYRPLVEYMYKENNKVYFYDSCINEFQLLYDFGAQPNDKWGIRMGCEADSIYIIVDSINYININSNILKVLYTTYTSNSIIWTVLGNKIIENIGDTWYMFSWNTQLCDENFGGPLRCYEDSLIGLYETSVVPYCEYIYTSTDNYLNNENSIIIYPNPVKNKLILYTTKEENKKVFIYIYDSEGKLVFKRQDVLLMKENEFDVSSASKGILFIKIISKNYIISKYLIKM